MRRDGKLNFVMVGLLIGFIVGISLGYHFGWKASYTTNQILALQVDHMAKEFGSIAGYDRGQKIREEAFRKSIMDVENLSK